MIGNAGNEWSDGDLRAICALRATEEPLKEAHETTRTTRIFFVGFLVVVVFDLLTSGAGA